MCNYWGIWRGENQLLLDFATASLLELDSAHSIAFASDYWKFYYLIHTSNTHWTKSLVPVSKKKKERGF